MASPSGRKELQLQGPRPTALKINKDSHLIKKPPLPPNQPRPPVIIYTVSPKIIHTNARDFKDLVQRLTGLRSSSAPSEDSDQLDVSAAAHYATVEKATNSPQKKKHQRIGGDMIGGMQGMETMMMMSHHVEAVERAGYFPAGILSPTPTLLQPVSSNFFTPPVDPSPFSNFCQELLSPVFQSLQNLNHPIPVFQSLPNFNHPPPNLSSQDSSFQNFPDFN